jgi:hypothetical protein
VGWQPKAPPPPMESIPIQAAKREYIEDRIDADEMERRIDHALRDPVAAWAAFAVGGPSAAPLKPSDARASAVPR